MFNFIGYLKNCLVFAFRGICWFICMCMQVGMFVHVHVFEVFQLAHSTVSCGFYFNKSNVGFVTLKIFMFPMVLQFHKAVIIIKIKLVLEKEWSH